jgi:hypothetical protein
MKKVLWLIVCLMTMVIGLTSCNSKANDYPKTEEEKTDVICDSWHDLKIDADELTGTKEHTVYYYSTKDGEVVVPSDNKEAFIFSTFDGIFDTNYERGEWVAEVIIGLYDINDKLIEKIENGVFFVLDNGLCGTGDDKINNKINSFIKTKKGFVRVVASKYADENFDIKVPCMNN